MRRSIAIAQQSGNPQGIIGRIIAFIMSLESKGMNKIGLDLHIQPLNQSTKQPINDICTLEKGWQDRDKIMLHGDFS
jgi:hypothetical protein